MQLASSELTICTTAFNPVLHGFHFENIFKLKPGIFGIRLGSWKMGLCGGMCSGALYRFKNNIISPSDTVPPNDRTDLFKEIFNRQKTSLSISLIHKVYALQTAPDQSHWYRKHCVGYRTKREWPKLQNRLDSGIPTIIVLISVKGCFQNLTKNHKVLAIGYEYNQSNKTLIIHTYDPNIPDKINHLTMNFDLANNNISASDSSGDRLRGFFINPYGGIIINNILNMP